MINLESHLSDLYAGVKAKDKRYKLLGYDVVQDISTGLIYHLHQDKPFELYLGDKLVLTGRGLTNEEAHILETVAKIIYHEYIEVGRGQVFELLSGKAQVVTQSNGGYKKED